MNEIMKLKELADFGIPVLVLARECHCSVTSIRNYLSGASIPNGSKTLAIQDGVNHIAEIINHIARK